MDSIRRYLHFVRPYRFQIIATIVIGIIKFAIPLMIPLLIKYVLDDIVGNDTMSKADKIEQLMMIMVIMIVVFVILRPPIEYYPSIFMHNGLQVKFYMISVNSYIVIFKDLALNFTPIRKPVKSSHG